MFDGKPAQVAGPVRTCLGCGARKRQQDLWSFALAHGKVVADPGRGCPGRHVYCCRNRQCFDVMFKNRKRLARAFRVRVVEYDEEMIRFFGSRS